MTATVAGPTPVRGQRNDSTCHTTSPARARNCRTRAETNSRTAQGTAWKAVLRKFLAHLQSALAAPAI
jgi:hypothetical protein